VVFSEVGKALIISTTSAVSLESRNQVSSESALYSSAGSSCLAATTLSETNICLVPNLSSIVIVAHRMARGNRGRPQIGAGDY
jgi:hypothetical protein